MKKFFRDFKAFISRGNIVDMAVGVIIGGAFSAIVTALTNKIIMPLINLALSGTGGLDKAYTFLKKVYINDNKLLGVDLERSIFIDWGAFITAVIDFLLIALVLFIVLKIVMKSSEMLRSAKKAVQGELTKEDKEELKKRGINKSDKAAVEAYLAEKAEKAAKAKAEEEAKAKLAEEEAKKNSTEYLLKEIRDLLAENKELKSKAQKAKK